MVLGSFELMRASFCLKGCWGGGRRSLDELGMTDGGRGMNAGVRLRQGFDATRCCAQLGLQRVGLSVNDWGV